MNGMALDPLVAALRASRGFAHKQDISGIVTAFGRQASAAFRASHAAVVNGDDCAAIPDGHGGFQLFAIEGLVEDFIERMPWFAGYSAVMVNVSDICAMGGRATAVVDALWSAGQADADEVIAGMASAAERYGVPIVGGHTNVRSDRPQLAVAILGQARRLLSSFAARAGDDLVVAVDLRGQWQEPFPYWNASTAAPPERLRGDCAVLPLLAESGLCEAAKDISMGGVLGTAIMLLEASGVGARIDLDALPSPNGVDGLRWLCAFPSYGFVLSVAPGNVPAVCAAFRARGIACEKVGRVDASTTLRIASAGVERELWNYAQASFIAPCSSSGAPRHA